MEEAEIATGCRRGEAKAQRALYDSYAPRLMATIVRYVGRGDVAQDVLQDTLVRALRGFSQFKWRGKGSLGGWLNRMAVNMSLNYLRDNRHMLQAVSLDERPEAGLVADEPTPADVEGLDLAELMRLVEELPTGYRTVFNLYCIEGYSHREIASELGISVNTSSSQLARAKAMLARKINDYVARKEMHYEPGN
ncbi:MAG: RNA polymerase sigma factor [Sodaliphilus pleomorphus]|jgi:RNA polymerase sigma-70 factor (ECF subfamily)|uniref:RNA polymerase sigma factor n=1 Tax=Sodaliphilus pleomorphus TaxID=2606626 RepID=UPI00240911B1|nr:RNA polymerase sigma factor [Sodaliphilus pleomorphus]MDD6474825.1 RNA polymerase sigma factor [Sodaliphilus pleomorphus]MDD6686123.1 RNA polymerase sigma factor [Sodaliphilus pleomorphus]MDY6251430.1 RNA polymerase sigma factor [Bacteroidales bacterium]MDY6260154.1 RNA polymerase sigma factor [Bacteroidales bacterium]